MDRVRRSLLAGAAALVLLSGAAPAGADEYDPKRAGHPLRIVAYVVHPVGVVIDYLIDLRTRGRLSGGEPRVPTRGKSDCGGGRSAGIILAYV